MCSEIDCLSLFTGEHLRYLNREVRTRNHTSSDEAFLDVHVPIAALEDSEVDPDAVSLQLLDTPGPNEAGEESLKFQVHAHDNHMHAYHCGPSSLLHA